MRKKIILIVMAVFVGFSAFSQVRDVTLSLSPYAEHTWWNKNTTLDNSTFWGARAGFSFGPLFEIRGFYQKSFDVEANLRKMDWSVTDDWADKMTQSYVDIYRYGGEMKLNLMNNRVFAPYVTLGGGIQNLSYEIESLNLLADANIQKMKEEQIFAALGLGTKINLSDRIVLSLEAKHTLFNVNDKSYYLSPDYDIAEGETKRLGNWSAMASLDFYLGGTNARGNEVHRAYEKMFSDGFSGMKFVIEPGLTYMNLKDETLFEEQYFLGASAGVDFSSLVGIRGFYYRATDEPDKISLDFSKDVEMYGGNLIARLNQPRGVNPYLVLGGGYIKTSNKYINPLGEMGDQSRGFAMGGVGIEIPVSKYIALYGAVNAILTNEGGKDLSVVGNPKQVKTSMMYQTGIRFNIGKSVDGDNYLDRTLDRAIASEREYNNEQINELRSDYEQRIRELNKEIDSAVSDKNYDRVSRIEDEKKALAEEYRKISAPKGDNNIQLTPEELSKIVKEAVIEARKEFVIPQVAPVPQVREEPASEVEAESKTRAVTEQLQQQQPPVIVQQVERDDQLNRQIESLNKAIEKQSSEIARLTSENAQQSVTASAVQPVVKSVTVASAPKDPIMKMNGVSALGAMDFGSRHFWNLGLRGHWQIKESDFEFVPEFFVAFGKKDGFGISANVLYHFGDDFSTFRPYVGVGVGGFPGKKTVWGTNIMAGVSYDLMIGSVFADYSIRNVFRQNQLAIGYRISF